MPFGKRLSWPAAVIAAACVLALVFGLPRAARAAGAFSDTGGHWAEQSILKMNAFGVVQGFPDGTFRPKESIEFQQALVMIMNALGWAEEAAKTDPAGLVMPVETWAKGYLALAVKKGMLNKDALPSLNPRRPATRLEVASLLCLALKLEPDQSALTFSDTDKINASYRGYVGAIVKKGIMIGLPGNLFAPEGEITRAQMCVLLSRAIDKNLIDPPPPNKRLVGRITGVDRENGTLTVRSLSGEETVSYAGGCPLYDGDRKVAAGALAENRRIELILTSDGKKVLYGGLLGDPGAVRSEEEGFVKSFAPGRGGYTLVLEPEEKAELSLGVYEDARLFKGGRELTAGEIKPDRYLRALLDGNGKVLEMELYDPVTVSGTLLALNRDTLTVKSQGTEKEYGFSKNIRVTRNGIRPMSLAELKAGDYVSVLTLKDRVYAVDC
ncbi:MAG: S-layer homology domain-containing protein, partial [Desulfotomaculales bacterium]